MSDMNVKQSQDGVTPLHLACRYNSAAVTQFLLFRQADINAADAKGRTPLHYATRRGNDIVTKVNYTGFIRFIIVFYRPHRMHSMHKMWLVATDGVASSVVAFVCMFVGRHICEPCKLV